LSNEITTNNQQVAEVMNVEKAMQLAEMLASSSMIPEHFKGKPGNVFVAIQWGHEIGLKPMQAMQNIMVIGGRPAIWGDALIGLVRSSPVFESIEETFDSTKATCTVKRKGEKPVTRVFTMADAQRAGLDKKPGPWKDFPQRMLQMRARSFALRDVFPDVLKGMHVAEEAMDFAPADVVEIDSSIADELIEQIELIPDAVALATHWKDGVKKIQEVNDKNGYSRFKEAVSKHGAKLKAIEDAKSAALVPDANDFKDEPIDVSNLKEVERQPGEDDDDAFLAALDKSPDYKK